MRPGPDPRASRWIAVRIGVLAVLFAAGFAVVGLRAVQLQIVNRDALVDDMVDQYRRQLVLRPRRGSIADRAGVLLAGSADARSVFADPWVLQREDRSGAALRKVAAALGQDPAALRRKLQKASRFVWLARRVSPQEAAEVERIAREAKLRGVALVQETRRYYPKGDLASQVLGFVGDDGNGLEGVELAFDDVLAGAPAKVPSLRDGAGRTVLAGAPSAGREREGARVELTLDQNLQLAAERAVATAVSGSRAASGMAVALDPRTGEILALAGWPRFNPNTPRRGDVRNRAVSDAFEPGSTMKTFAIAGALERGALRPLDPIDCGTGTLEIGSHVIHDHEAFGWAGASRILASSSNIGAARVAARLGKQGLHDTLLAFGFGERTGLGLPGEARGQVPFPRSDVALATQSFGQGLTATALQVTTAMAAIANGGLLVRPTLVKRVVDPATGEVLDAAEQPPARRVVSAEVAATVARWLVGVIEDERGTGKRARLAGWRAAGKTGTAQKADLVSGGYSADKRFSSFVGFAPADAPRIVIGVFVDEPKDEIYGGEIAAPAFREVAEYAMKMLGVPPTGPVVAAAPPRAPVREPPPPPPPVEQAPRRPAPSGGVPVPSLSGLPARAAIRTLEALDLAADLDGSGRVIGQSPAAGRVVARGTRVRMRLQPAG